LGADEAGPRGEWYSNIRHSVGLRIRNPIPNYGKPEQLGKLLIYKVREKWLHMYYVRLYASALHVKPIAD
jgi:hypothetical protein